MQLNSTISTNNIRQLSHVTHVSLADCRREHSVRLELVRYGFVHWAAMMFHPTGWLIAFILVHHKMCVVMACVIDSGTQRCVAIFVTLFRHLQCIQIGLHTPVCCVPHLSHICIFGQSPRMCDPMYRSSSFEVSNIMRLPHSSVLSLSVHYYYWMTVTTSAALSRINLANFSCCFAFGSVACQIQWMMLNNEKKNNSRNTRKKCDLPFD